MRRGGYSLSNMQVAAGCAKIGIVFGLSKLSLGRGVAQIKQASVAILKSATPMEAVTHSKGAD